MINRPEGPFILDSKIPLSVARFACAFGVAAVPEESPVFAQSWRNSDMQIPAQHHQQPCGWVSLLPGAALTRVFAADAQRQPAVPTCRSMPVSAEPRSPSDDHHLRGIICPAKINALVRNHNSNETNVGVLAIDFVPLDAQASVLLRHPEVLKQWLKQKSEHSRSPVETGLEFSFSNGHGSMVYGRIPAIAVHEFCSLNRTRWDSAGTSAYASPAGRLPREPAPRPGRKPNSPALREPEFAGQLRKAMPQPSRTLKKNRPEQAAAFGPTSEIGGEAISTTELSSAFTSTVGARCEPGVRCYLRPDTSCATTDANSARSNFFPVVVTTARPVRHQCFSRFVILLVQQMAFGSFFLCRAVRFDHEGAKYLMTPSPTAPNRQIIRAMFPPPPSPKPKACLRWNGDGGRHMARWFVLVKAGFINTDKRQFVPSH
ncbi:uncharacterized protein ATNIH1004_002051 [Aspergillus tanneri]|uniref:Uncharacterized protein n=1 Tax=Aspergillus tanneri TaxID=1220188 RepID=A0A5M9M3P2_9EURO|nr:uncharacterized protein ATNIH1004_002051 [Aspergillus tanneri]KAA8641311.1 hypothetical protein ATNIH1004_002051 [Aspergillus tanneri]